MSGEQSACRRYAGAQAWSARRTNPQHGHEPMIEFFKTQMGRAFYEGAVPRLIRAVERLADAVEKANEDVCPVCGTTRGTNSKKNDAV